jgi:hypothetical protein
MIGAPVQLKRYTSEVLMVCTTGLNLMSLPTRVFVPSLSSEMSFRWYQAARYSVFMNQPGELVRGRLRQLSVVGLAFDRAHGRLIAQFAEENGHHIRQRCKR